MKVDLRNEAIDISTISVDLGSHVMDDKKETKTLPETTSKATTETDFFDPVTFGTNKDLAAMLVKKNQLSHDMADGVESAIDRITIQSKLNEINSEITQVTSASVIDSEANIAANPDEAIKAQGVVAASDVAGLLM